ncbi:MAG: hypothetical protein KA319_03070 [Ferruginibacter sp.]|nr:hypothetical protein [Ferruginibacter sp.]
MRKIMTAVLLLVATTIVNGQQLTQVNITGVGITDCFIVSLPENVQVYVSKDGSIIKWGFDRFIGIQENYGGQLEPYVGRVEYYTQNDDVAFRGKVRYIGRNMITYYASYEGDVLKGKIKTIGTTTFNYFFNNEDAAYQGNLKQIGQQSITWYSNFDNEGYRGKLKSVGITNLTYYGSFEDKAFKGKIKNIGGTAYTYYSSYEKYSGSMKTGNSILTVNTVKYFVR